MKDTFYFSHDYNSRSDEKVKLLIRKHGMLGYGCFWAIIEDLYQNANALRTDYEGIAFDLRIDISLVKSILNDFDLFIIDGEMFGSLSVERRLNERNIKSKKAKESANSRWEQHRLNANALQKDANALRSECEGNAIKESKVKEKESKEEKKDKRKTSVFVAPTVLEVIYYFKEKGYTEYAAVKAFDYYSVADWIDSKGNKVLNWKQKMQSVWFKDENKDVKLQPKQPTKLAI